MSEQVASEAGWAREAEAAIGDIRKHVQSAAVSAQRGGGGQRALVNLTTLEGQEYCVEVSAAGFRVVGLRHDSTALATAAHACYETPYALLNAISQKYRESFGGELMNKLLDLANKAEG